LSIARKICAGEKLLSTAIFENAAWSKLPTEAQVLPRLADLYSPCP
jgi:hypothetical protein